MMTLTYIRPALIWLVFLCVASTSALTGCGPSTRYKAPERFVDLEDDQLPYEAAQKSVSPDGALIMLRERDNEPKGDLAFWSEALRNELTDGRGYELLATEDVTGSRGFKGKLFALKGTHQGVVYRYDVSIFVRDDLIITIECAAPEDQYETYKTPFAGARQSLTYR